VRKKKNVFVLYVGIEIKTKDSHNDADCMSSYDPPGLSSGIFRHRKIIKVVAPKEATTAVLVNIFSK